MSHDWVRLCMLLDEDPELPPTVRRARTDPWLALIDGLDDAGALAYLDRDDTGVELAEVLTQLPRIVRTGADLEEVADVEGDLTAAIIRADGLLRVHHLRLVYLEEDATAYPLVAAPVTNVPEILELVGRLGQQARVFG